MLTEKIEEYFQDGVHIYIYIYYIYIYILYIIYYIYTRIYKHMDEIFSQFPGLQRFGIFFLGLL